MRTLITSPKFRWFTSLVALTAITVAAFFLSNAVGRQTQSAPASPDAPSVADATSAITFSTPLELTGHPASPAFFQADAEPEIKVDLFGNIYVTAIQGIPGGTDLWKSVDKGASFAYLGQPDGAQDHCNPPLVQCVAVGGGDDSIDVSSGGYLYVSSLWLGSVTMSTSLDGGMGGTAPGQAWAVNPAVATIPGDDRQWIAAYGPQTVYMTYTDIGTGVIDFQKSTDAGQTFGPPVQTMDPLGSLFSDVQGNLSVDKYNGNICSAFVQFGANNNLYLNRSTDGGNTWQQKLAYSGPAGSDNRAVFPMTAIDRGGNVYIAFTNCGTGHTNCRVYMVSSGNFGDTWSTAHQVNDPVADPNTLTAVQPAIVAGSAGYVDIAWLGSKETTPDACPNKWYVFFAQTPNALAVTPTFTQTVTTTGVMHDKDICFGGLSCGASPSACNGNRDMLEYFSMTLDPDGNANIAYADSTNSCPPGNCRSNTWFIKQTGGPSAYSPPAAPAAATFAANIPVGSPGAEPSIWVDSFNCIYATAPGNPWVWKSVDGGASFLSPTNPVADESTLTGGDEDIISLPKQDGSNTRPDQLYFTDLGLSSCHIRKSTAVVSPANQNPVWFKPGASGSAGDVSVSSDRQWLAWDQKFPTTADQIIYHWEHELASEAMRISSLFNDTAWVFTSGMTDPELVALLSSTIPNTNPGPVFTNKTTHRVFGLFNASIPLNNAMNPPFGKLLNVWEMDAAAPTLAASPVTDVQNHPVFKGLIDSPNNPPPAVGPPVGPTYGTNNANIFPAGDIDSAGNIYVAWSMNNSRTNEFSIWFASSHDGGKTYYGPFWVSTGPMTADETAVFPWVAAGDNGRVDIIWYATTAVGDPNTITGNPAWKLYFAQSLNANTREPVFTVVQPNPANVIHNGQISTGGLLGSSDRSLLDFMEVAIGPDGLANIIFADNAGQGTRAEYTRQNGGPVAKTSPTSPSCLPIPPVASVVSRKVHGGAGTGDIPLPLTGTRGVECRSPGQTGPPGADYKVIFTFVNNITNCGTTSTAGGVVASGPAANQCTVNLTGTPNAQYTTVALNGVIDAVGNNGPASAVMGLLVGDVNASGVVTTGDTNLCKAQALQPVTFGPTGNFRNDINASGAITTGDVNLIKQNALTQLPTPP